MRNKKLALNTISSLLFQITTIICGFILPRLILGSYGSEVNGLVNSISQFLGIISFLELGMGAVVQSSLYKPLADHDSAMVSKIIRSANRFFRKLALILLVYVLALIVTYPFFTTSTFDFAFIAFLIGAMCISSFAQYYFGVVDRLLLTADQRGYVQFFSQTITLILNTLVCSFLIRLGGSIQLVKLTTSVVFLGRPIFLRWYVNKHYSIDRKIEYEGEPIKQKWNGVAQHVSAVILDGTDTIVLTIFSTLSNVSVYSVYHLVVYGVKQLFTSMTNGIQALLGELWAKQEMDTLRKTFSWTEWIIHTGVVLIFGCTASLIVPFVQVYTKGVTDIDYSVPSFALLITIAHAMHCIRLPYNLMILAGGHYKQTQSNYVIAAAINIIVSVIMVSAFGLVGVAIGTLVAMLYQTVWMAWYDSKNFMNWPISSFIKQMSVDAGTFIICYYISIKMRLVSLTYLHWLLLAAEVFFVWLTVIIMVNLIFYRPFMKSFFSRIRRRFIRNNV